MLESIIVRLMPDAAGVSRRQRISDWIGLVGLTLFCFFSLLSVAGASLGLVLMLFGLLISPEAWRHLPRQPLFWVSLLSAAYVALRAVWPTLEIVGDPEIQSNQAKDWALLFLFFIPAWWISRTPSRSLFALNLMFIGFTLGILTALDGEFISRFQAGVRSGLHFGKPIIFGFDCAVAILALTALAAHDFSLGPEPLKRKRPLRIALALFGMLFFLQGLIVSQSRGVWLALLVALPAAILILRYAGGPPHPLEVKERWWGLAGGVTILGLVLLLNWGTITGRLTQERHELGAAISEGLEEAPLSSITYRLHLWKFGIDKWLERPFTGWGPGTTYALIDAENSVALKNPGGKSFDHLHNAYLEVLLQLGLTGLLLTLLCAALMLRCILADYRRGNLSIPMLAFLLSNFVLIAIYSLTDFRHLHWNWRFYWLILAGIVLAHRLDISPKRTGRSGLHHPYSKGGLEATRRHSW